MDKKAQIQHVFIYILTMVVVGLILLMGYRIIENTIEQGCEVEYLKFTSDLRGMIDRYDAYGSYHPEKISAPCEYEQICFVDADVVANPGSFNADNKIILDSVKDKVQQNIFLIGSTTKPIGFIDKIMLNDSAEPLCFNAVTGQFRIGFRGDGLRTKIEEY